jgi:hypothetical protein
MKSPSSTASIRYSGQCFLNASTMLPSSRAWLRFLTERSVCGESIFLSQKLSEEFDLVEVARAPRADVEVQT